MHEAVRLKQAIAARFAEVGLTLSEEKTHIVYIDTFQRRNVPTCFTFLGYDFRVLPALAGVIDVDPFRLIPVGFIFCTHRPNNQDRDRTRPAIGRKFPACGLHVRLPRVNLPATIDYA